MKTLIKYTVKDHKKTQVHHTHIHTHYTNTGKLHADCSATHQNYSFEDNWHLCIKISSKFFKINTMVASINKN